MIGLQVEALRTYTRAIISSRSNSLRFLYLVLLLSLYIFSTAANAVEATSDTSAKNSIDENPDRPGLVDYVNKYEYGLDIRKSTILNEDATMLQAQWNKRYLWGTWIGIGLGSTMESTELTEDENKTSVSLIYGGFNIEQTIFRYSTWLKGHLGVFFGRGKLFARYEPSSEEAEDSLNDLDITVVEPYFVATFYNRWGIEFGANFATRGVTSSEKTTVNDVAFSESDYSGVEMGLTFRRGL